MEAAVPTLNEPDDLALALQHGRIKKRDNAIAAVLSGVIPGVILALYFPVSREQWFLGVVVGLIWGNAFEYAYHRWLLHRPRSVFARGHLEHHANVGTPEEPEYVSLGKSPAHTALLFVLNGIIAVAVDLLLGLGISPGIFIGWTVYMVTTEEIHWRIHLDGWLPPGLRFARAYHMQHHDTPNSRYNVFLPLFDFLFGNCGSGRKSQHLAAADR
jgi:hypothetical protein